MLNPLNLLSKIIKSPNQREIERLKKIVSKVNNLEQNYKTLKNDEFHQKTNQLKERLKNDENIDLILPEAFALVREASKRILGERHFDVQIMGGVVLHEGKIAEMKTGEGKTLTITLAAFLNALRNKGVHVVTVNDYLAKRDSEWMGEVYKKLGLTTGFIVNNLSDNDRKIAYELLEEKSKL